MTIAEYLATCATQPIAPVRAKALEAMTALADAGARIDARLALAERVKAEATVEDAQRVEQTVQTLDALSREVWAGHTAALKVTRICLQLERVEAELAAGGQP